MMRVTSFSDMNCSIAGTLEAIGDRWGFLVLRDLTMGLARYDEFQASTGIPPQTLASRLKHLESSGLVERRQYQKRPPRDEYVLTRKGRDLWVVLTALREWGDRWNAHGATGAPLEILDRRSGRHVGLALVDSESGMVVPADALDVRPGPGADDRMRHRLRRWPSSNGEARAT